MNNRILCPMLTMGVFFSSLPASTQKEFDSGLALAEIFCENPSDKTESNENKQNPDNRQTDGNNEVESLFPNASKSLAGSHFSWGAEIGSSIDVSGYDSSTFNVDAVIGYKNNYFKIAGIGIGIHRALGTGDNYVPVYAVMRTSFSKRPRLFFFSLKAGYSFNTIGDAPTFGDVNASIGAGINLAMSRRFQTHIILSYEFRHFNKRHRNALELDAEDISLASLTFGVNF